MAREKMITRATTQTTVEIMCLNILTAEVSIETYTIGGTLSDDEALKKLRHVYESTAFKLVAVQKLETETLLLGMTEEDFIKYATVLPPRKGYSKKEES